MDSVQRAHLMRKQSLQRDIFSRHVFNPETVVGAVGFHHHRFSRSVEADKRLACQPFLFQGTEQLAIACMLTSTAALSDSFFFKFCQSADNIITNCSTSTLPIPGGANARPVPAFVSNKKPQTFTNWLQRR